MEVRKERHIVVAVSLGFSGSSIYLVCFLFMSSLCILKPVLV